MEFGKSLRAAREAKGYTVSQIAETTHIKSSIVEGLENDDFSSIVAPIYGRGFVKLYCEAVGLDPKPFVDEFMEIVNGNRDVPIRERVADIPAAQPVAEPIAEPIAEPTAQPAAPDVPPPPSGDRDLFTQEEAQPSLSRYASPFRTEDRAPAEFPVLPWRLIVLGVTGLALLVILGFGVRALYRATSTTSERPDAKAVENAESKVTPPGKPAEKPAARAQQQDIPSLYID